MFFEELAIEDHHQDPSSPLLASHPAEGGPRSASGEGEARNGPLKQNGSRHGDSSTAGKGKRRLPRSVQLQVNPLPPPGQEGGAGPQAQLQHLSLAVSLSLSLPLPPLLYLAQGGSQTNKQTMLKILDERASGKTSVNRRQGRQTSMASADKHFPGKETPGQGISSKC